MITRRRFVRGVAGAAGGAAAFGAVWALTGCAPTKPEVTPSANDEAPDFIVQVVDNAYEPRELSVRPGQAVQWEFLGSQEHDVVAEDESFVCELMKTGTYTHVFETPGEFAYLCSIHPEMTGVVFVEE